MPFHTCIKLKKKMKKKLKSVLFERQMRSHEGRFLLFVTVKNSFNIFFTDLPTPPLHAYSFHLSICKYHINLHNDNYSAFNTDSFLLLLLLLVAVVILRHNRRKRVTIIEIYYTGRAIY